MNLKSRFVVPIRSRYTHLLAYGCDTQFELEIVSGNEAGATNDGFLLNALRTLFNAIQGTFRSLEMHALWNYKTCICPFILGELELFRNY